MVLLKRRKNRRIAPLGYFRIYTRHHLAPNRYSLPYAHRFIRNYFSIWLFLALSKVIAVISTPMATAKCPMTTSPHHNHDPRARQKTVDHITDRMTISWKRKTLGNPLSGLRFSFITTAYASGCLVIVLPSLFILNLRHIGLNFCTRISMPQITPSSRFQKKTALMGGFYRIFIVLS